MRFFLLRVLFAAEAIGAAYGFIETLMREEAVVFFSLPVSGHFLEVAYVFLIALGILAVIGLSWTWIIRQRPIAQRLASKVERFGMLYAEIAERRDELNRAVEHDDQPESQLRYTSRLWELATTLRKLGVKCPRRPPDLSGPNDADEGECGKLEWCLFLMRLAALARESQLGEARRSLDKLRSEHRL